MEIWVDVIGFESGYEISNFGRLKSKLRVVDYGCKKAIRKEKILKPRVCPKRGYEYTVLSIDKNRKTVKIHRLVAEAFIDNISNKPSVNHINGIKTDNKASNLEWVTASENTIHAFKYGLKKSIKAENSHLSKLNRITIEKIRNEYIKNKISQKKLATKYNISQAQISRIVNYTNWKD
jgi:DNA-binding transcriptional regulator YiaG